MRSILAAFAFFILLVAPVIACEGDTCLSIQTATEIHDFTVEIAENDAERALGLMYRKSLAPDAGMLFDFQADQQVAFWMRNTLIPLDMIFIRADGTIANVHPEAVPGDLTSIPSDGPVRFVLEIPGGRAAELGIAAGDRLVHPRVTEAES